MVEAPFNGPSTESPRGSSQTIPGSKPIWPWWVTVLDLITLTAVLVAFALLLGYRPRFSLGGLVIRASSLERAVVWAVASAGVRHLFHPAPALPTRLANWVAALRSACPAAVRYALPIFLLSRASVLLVGYFAVLIVGYPSRDFSFEPKNELWKLPMKWDATYYRDIARNGYTWSGDASRQGVLAFFPAYPLISRAVGSLVGSIEAGLFIVALGSFFWALTYLFRLAREFLDEPHAESSLLFLAFGPFAVFYSADYTESLFLLGSVAAFFHFSRRDWWAAAAWGFLLGLTRPNGCLMSLPLGWLALEQARREARSAVRASDWARRLAVASAAACAPILALLAHSWFVYRVTGDPLTWMRIQAAWGRGLDNPSLLMSSLWTTMSSGWRFWFESPVDAMQCIVVVLTLASVWPVIRRFGFAYGLFMLVNLMPALLTGGMFSSGRFTSTLFPMFLWLAAVVPPERRAPWIAATAVVQGFVATTFFTWRALA